MNRFDTRMTRRRYLAAALGLVWAGPALGAGVHWQPWSRPTIPALQLPTLDGTLWSLAAHKGQPVLLNFWASWCAPCRAEMPSLVQLAARYAAQGLQVMAVNYGETNAAVRRFMETTALQLPVLLDGDGKAAKAFGVRIFPTSVGINRQGQVQFVVLGECDWNSALASRWIETLFL